jgi:hypothetical protein
LLISNAAEALLVSACVTLLALFIFGMVKGKFTGVSPLKRATQTIFGRWLGGGRGLWTGETHFHEVEQSVFWYAQTLFSGYFLPGWLQR